MTGPARGDPTAALDALVAVIAPRIPAPTVRHRDVILVAGPWLSGVSGVLVALRERLPHRIFAEAVELAGDEAPAAVVFVVSAAAALTDSDAALLDAAVAHTDVVIGAVSKTDIHRQWPEMLEVARDALAARAPRYRDMPWVAVAAAPGPGEPRVDGLVAELEKRLAGADVHRRNRLRSWESQLREFARRYDRDADGAGRRARVALLKEQRDAALRARRLAKSGQIRTLRGEVAKARVRLSHFTRTRCSSMRSELLEDAARMTRGRLPGFRAHLRSRVEELITEVGEDTAAHLGGLADDLGLTIDLPRPAPPEIEVGAPDLGSRRLETQLMMLLGLGFGLGVALTLSRILAGLAPGPTATGAGVCAVTGLAAATWVVRVRGLLRDRAVLDRWVTEVASAARSAAEELVALRILAVETSLSAELAERNETDGTAVAARVAALDRELRGHAAAVARAAALRDREMPALRRALAAVRAELGYPPADRHAAPVTGQRRDVRFTGDTPPE